MDPSIIVAIVTGAFTLCGTVVTVYLGNKKNAKQSKEQTDLTIYRIGELEKKQDKYNHLQERTAKVEKDLAVLKEDIHAIHEKIDILHSGE